MITWTTEQRKLGELVEWDRNPRQLSKHDAEQIAQSIETFNLADPLVINQDNQIIGGHQRKRVMLDSGYSPDDLVDVRVPSRELTDEETAELNIRLNRNAGEWDFDVLANEFELGELLEWGFRPHDLGIIETIDYADLWQGMPEFQQDDIGSFHSVKVHFANAEDVAAFAALVEQNVTNRTVFIWYPKQERADLRSLEYTVNET